MDLTLACADTPRTRHLFDGSVGIADHRLRATSLPPEEMFRRAFETAEFDISELSFSTYLLHVDRGTCRYLGIPVFPSRAFRHAAIYVRSGSGIAELKDLRGRAIGVRSYLNTAALVVRGLLHDACGIRSDEIDWWVGDVDQVERDSIPVPSLLRQTRIQPAPHGRTLSDMLIDGSIDALVHYHPPRGFGTDASPVRRLFADTAAAEHDYFRSTGIFPIMHLIGIRRDLHERDPSLARQVYEAFGRAKDANIQNTELRSSPAKAPPLSNGGAATLDFTTPEFWPYGIAKNYAALAALSRYAFEQGLTVRTLPLEELFVPELLAT
jgi:4,5-dihydroxyphthalate decarboxylase